MEHDAIELIDKLDNLEVERELTPYEKGVRDALTWAFDSNEMPCSYLD